MTERRKAVLTCQARPVYWSHPPANSPPRVTTSTARLKHDLEQSAPITEATRRRRSRRDGLVAIAKQITKLHEQIPTN